MMLRAWMIALVAPLLATSSATVATGATPIKVGVYYFPGWIGTRDASWTPIKAAGDREPLQGWYDSGEPATLARQVDQMRRHGIDYVAFDWYWEGDHVHGDHAVRAYLKLPQKSVSFSLLWANDKPFTQAQWTSIVQFWIANYFHSPNYLKIDGKPVVFVLTYQGMHVNAQVEKTTVAAYVATAQRMARAAGLPGLYLVANFDDLSTTLVTDDTVTAKAGFSAVSAYNMHRGPWRGERPGWYKLTRGYPALDQAYRQHWDEAFRGSLPVVIPMTSGWDSRPWGGSADPLHDRSIATPAQFAEHLAAARRVMERHGDRARLGVICCWNEFGEGSFIEPTRKAGMSQLEQVRRIFGGG